MVHMCKRIISPGGFLYIYQILICGLNRSVKGQKVAQNDQQLCPSHCLSQEAYIIMMSLVVQFVK